MRVILVNMPWALIDVPSLALGILRRSALLTLPDVEIEVLHATFDYFDRVHDLESEHGETFCLDDYHHYSPRTYFQGLGDWVFSSALHDDPEWRVRELIDSGTVPEQDLVRTLRLHRGAPDFVEDLSSRIAQREPDLVGFTSTFQQNVAALAVARCLKQRSPGILTVLGGANCEGAQGPALHRNFDFLDFVCRGEGEVIFPRLLGALSRAGGPGTPDPQDLADVPGLCWRDGQGRTVTNPTAAPLPIDRFLAPDYDGFFERFAASAVGRWTEPKLVVEGARGCWWGHKHHCTFCGLNGSVLDFRSKDPAIFREEIVDLVRRHQVLDLFVVDNILDMRYLNSLVPQLADAGYDLRLQYEIKSNLDGDQLRSLAAAGIITVQPGIENLHSRVLSLMSKGVTGCRNVRMLRDSCDAGLTVSWNYLCGFPGEQAEDYLSIVGQMPALHHLPPPGEATRIVLERFSPLFDEPRRGFAGLSPDPQYALVHDLPERELMDLAYLFSAPSRGIGQDVLERVRAATDRWAVEHPRSRLSHQDLGDSILLASDRSGFSWSVMHLTDPLRVAAFRLLGRPRTPEHLARGLVEAGLLSCDGAAERVEGLLAEWSAAGIVFTESGTYVHVAPAAANQELMRFALRQDEPGSTTGEPGTHRRERTPREGGAQEEGLACAR
jgi:ribosomal peptide maturation radical SAM protein 1